MESGKISCPKEAPFTVVENRAVTEKVSFLQLEGDTSAITAPGQFVMLSLPGMFLRRPFSVCDWETGRLSLLVERVGAGTEQLQALPCGTELSVLTGLGNGFTLFPDASPVLVGGGSGLSPLVGLARRLRSAGILPQVLLGFRNPEDRFGAAFFPGLEVHVAEDVFPVLRTLPHGCFYACGSEAMMEELCRRESVPGQVAFDVRMGCGFGACMGCAKRTRDGMKRVCKDGPVFRKEELLWED